MFDYPVFETTDANFADRILRIVLTRLQGGGTRSLVGARRWAVEALNNVEDVYGPYDWDPDIINAEFWQAGDGGSAGP